MLEFDPTPGHVVFVVVRFFLRLLPFSPFIVIFHAHIHVSTFDVVEYIMSVIDIIVKHNSE
jgi:hypothetical protein